MARQGVPVALLLLLVSRASWALPSYSRLVKQTYGYTVSCAICHTKEGGSALTPYGKDFQRNGLSLLALSRIAPRDSDKDGIPNLQEIQAKSNPGDPLSVPDTPGEWLTHIDEAAIPFSELKEGFSDAEGFVALEGTLKPDQIQDIESRLGSPLLDEDKVPIFYFAVKTVGGKKVKYGVVQFIRGDTVTLAVGVNLKGEIVFVKVVTAKDKSLPKETLFFNQFLGKTVEDAIRTGTDIQPMGEKKSLSDEISRLIKKGLLEIYAVFSKK
jgi:hypothetical protein